MTVAVIHATTAAGPNDPSKQVSSDAWNAGHTITGLATVAGTGAYSDLTGIPTTFLPSDGNKGDITVSGTGTAWAVNSAAITYAKIQNVSATSKFLGRKTAGAGSVEELSAADAKTILAIASTDVSGLATVATSGLFADLGSKPTTATGYGIASIDNVPIGATTASTGKFTTLAIGGNVTFTTDNTFDVGASSTRPRDVFIARACGAARFQSSSGNVLSFTDTAGGIAGQIGYESLGGTNRGFLKLYGTPGGAPSGLVALRSEGTGLLSQVDSANAQTYRFYGTFTDTSNYVRGSLAATATTVTLAAESAGTGAADISLTLTPKGAGVVTAPLYARSYSPGSFTLADETAAVLVNHLKLTSTQRATLSGSARLVLQ